MSVNRQCNCRRWKFDEERRWGDIKGFKTEIQCLWKLEKKRCQQNNVITGNNSELFRKYLSHISGEDDMKKRQKTATLRAAHRRLREVFLWNYEMFRMGNTITCTMHWYCKYRMAETIHILETWFLIYGCKHPA